MNTKIVSSHPAYISPWFNPQQAASYAGVGLRTLRSWLNHGLKHSQVSSRIIRIHRNDLDEYLRNHSVDAKTVDDIVNSVISGLQKG